MAGALLSVSGSCTRFACFSAASQLVAPGADADRGPSKAGYFFAPLKALIGSELPVLSGCDRAICNLSHASLVSVFIFWFFKCCFWHLIVREIPVATMSLKRHSTPTRNLAKCWLSFKVLLLPDSPGNM